MRERVPKHISTLSFKKVDPQKEADNSAKNTEKAEKAYEENRKSCASGTRIRAQYYIAPPLIKKDSFGHPKGGTNPGGFQTPEHKAYMVISNGKIMEGSYDLFIDAWLAAHLLNVFSYIVGPNNETWVVNPLETN